MAVDSPGKDPVTIWLDGARSLFGLAKNKRVASPDEVLKKSGQWDNPAAVADMRNAVENRQIPTTGNAAQLEILRRGKQYNLRVLDEQLDRLGYNGPDLPDEPDFSGGYPGTFPSADQDLSPVFGGAVAGMNMAGASEDLKKRVAKDLADKAKASKMKAAKARPVKLARTTPEKVIDAARKLLGKLPKSMLPDAELVKIGKSLGKALKGGLWPIAVQTVGTIAIEKAAKMAERAQFEKMTKILGPQDAAAYQLRKKLAKGPPTRGTRTTKPPEPPRPAAPKPGVVPRISVVGRKSPVITPSPVKVTLQKRPVPLRPISSAKGQTLPTAPLRKSINVSQLAGLLPRALLASRNRGSGSASGFRADDARPQPQPATLQRFSAAPTTTATGEKVCRCYTKKSGPRRKRKAPRVCVTPAAARKAGLLN